MRNIITKLRFWLIPQDSKREKLYHQFRLLLTVLRMEGLPKTIRRIRRWLRTRLSIGYRSVEHWLSLTNYTYEEWIQDHKLTPRELNQQRMDSKLLDYKPVISFITPVFNTQLEALKAMVESVQSQTYPWWELCLADGSSPDSDARKFLQEIEGTDNRIKISFLEENLGISANTNKAFELSTGDYIALLDHDDLVEPNMLFEIVSRLNQKPDTDLIYFDEDKVSESGKVRRDPFFKPDWSPEMLLSANYLTHPVIRREMFNKVGRLNPEMDGTQDWDLMLKISEETNRIEHIPNVLYHWRQVPGSTAAFLNAKSYVFDRQLRCVKEHLERRGIKEPKTEFESPGFLRAIWPASGKKVSIIIPTRDNVDYLRKCIGSIQKKTSYPNYEIIIVDNNSEKKETLLYFEAIKLDPGIHIVPYKETFNYSRANNLGAEKASGDILLFLNNDIEVLEPNWLDELVRWADQPEIGVVGTKLLYPDRTIQHAGVVIGMEGHASHVFWGALEKQSTLIGSVDWYRNLSAVTGACMMMRREVFQEVDGFNEEYILTFSDTEICLDAIQAGYRIVYTPYARLIHHEGRTRSDHIPPNDVLIGYRRMKDRVYAGDPYFNPNLSYLSRFPAIRDPNEESRKQRLKRIYQRIEKQIPEEEREQ